MIIGIIRDVLDMHLTNKSFAKLKLGIYYFKKISFSIF